ncbi:hypothetical protein PsorP6_018056 [Peronosclerospora sorghi]|uniref:Uncharacterized protein n=1 Tax=Peronosclerospora sorghi TaxID=230839 RepID=A0ACC0WD54_9STRA|nr:hypothetical protein PsorP6_018056 [Peronosclerospora sorghi]
MISYQLTLGAAQNIPYDTLMQDLDVSTVREVEDIIIDTIYPLHAAHILAEKEEENERTREENIRNKMEDSAAERGKSFASVGGSFRQGDDFSQYADSGTRRRFV